MHDVHCIATCVNFYPLPVAVDVQTCFVGSGNQFVPLLHTAVNRSSGTSPSLHLYVNIASSSVKLEL